MEKRKSGFGLADAMADEPPPAPSAPATKPLDLSAFEGVPPAPADREAAEVARSVARAEGFKPSQPRSNPPQAEQRTRKKRRTVSDVLGPRDPGRAGEARVFTGLNMPESVLIRLRKLQEKRGLVMWQLIEQMMDAYEDKGRR